nr:ABC transporter permease [Propionicimonas sp.]
MNRTALVRFLTKNSATASLVAILMIALVVFASLSPSFATGSNVLNIAIQGSATAIVATAMTFVIITSGIDLSVGSSIFLGGVILALGSGTGLPPVLLFLLVIGASVAVGALQGGLIGYLGLNPLLTTIGTMTILRGIGERISQMRPIQVAGDYTTFGTGRILGVPAPVLVALGFAIVAFVVDRYTSAGRLLRAIGSNPIGARESGVRTKLITWIAYVLVGLAVGIAALVMVGRLRSVNPGVGDGFELTVITAVVLGGTSLMGGSGSVVGSLLGAFLLATVENGLVLVGASPYWYDIFRAAVLILAVTAAALARQKPRWLPSFSSIRVRGERRLASTR